MAKHRAQAPRHRDPERERNRKRGFIWWNRRSKVVSGVIGSIMAGSMAFAVSNWVVGLNNGSSGEAQSASVSNLTVTASASPAAGNLLYPGGTGDVVISITNPNTFPVTLTGFNLPTSTTYAGGYSDSALTTPQAGCSAATPSYVTWTGANGVSGTAHSFSAAGSVVVAGGATYVVTMQNAASMGTSAPAACVSTYFSMPSFTGVIATAGGSATSGPATLAW